MPFTLAVTVLLGDELRGLHLPGGGLLALGVAVQNTNCAVCAADIIVITQPLLMRWHARPSRPVTIKPDSSILSGIPTLVNQR